VGVYNAIASEVANTQTETHVHAGPAQKAQLAKMPRPSEMSATMKLLYAVTLLIGGGATAQAAETSAGSGIVISTQGEILTNSHVVQSCAKITARFPSRILGVAALIARDEKNDLAVIRPLSPDIPAGPVATFREGSTIRAGESVVALGYPLSGLLASTTNLSVGNVSALAGLGDDSRYLQISAPVQPGNSGGPLLDASGHVVGIVTSKLNAVRVAKFTGDIPQNVNFAIKAEVVGTFLDSKAISYRKAASDQQLSPADVGDIARPFTPYIECEQIPPQVAAGDQPKPITRPKNASTPRKLWPNEGQLPPDPVSSLPRSMLTIDTRRGVQRFTVELALTQEQWSWGLRHPIATDAGMLYIYHPFSRSVAHSMKDTPISLDVLFINAHGHIAEIVERRPPMSEDIVESKIPVMTMLELSAGTVQRYHIKIGDSVRVPFFNDIFSMETPHLQR
jgi:S1-C subfamily serine protease/uncharacterized membrane protein (UPF0127 family)